MIDAADELIYVGKAKCLRTRLLSYFRRQSREPKAGRILARARAIVWEYLPSEFAALLRELELIRRWRPRYNVMGQPGRRATYVCLGKAPAPCLFLAHRPPPSTLSLFGPVPSGHRALEAVRRLNDCLSLRDCPSPQTMIFADDSELFPVQRTAGCLRHEIGTCLGPCAALCTRGGYHRQVRAAESFLLGDDATVLNDLRARMEACAATQAFEQAAALRDQLESLHWLRERLNRVRQARARRCFVYPVAGARGESRWYVIHHGAVVGAYPAPKDSPNRRTLRDVLEGLQSRALPRASAAALAEIETVILVSSWFRRHPAERQRTLDYTDAYAACS
jgi:excinuclease ABC subunit C